MEPEQRRICVNRGLRFADYIPPVAQNLDPTAISILDAKASTAQHVKMAEVGSNRQDNARSLASDVTLLLMCYLRSRGITPRPSLLLATFPRRPV